MELREKISALRKQRGMSQEQLAEQMFVSRQSISKWENGETVPDLANIVRLSEILGVSTDYLLKGARIEDTPPAPPYEDFAPKVSYKKGYDEDDEEEDKIEVRLKRGNILTINVWSAATIIYLVLGFVWHLWHPGWIIFLLPGLVSVVTIRKDE